MTRTLQSHTPPQPAAGLSLTHGRLPRMTPYLVLAGSLLLSVAIAVAAGFHPLLFALLTLVTFAVVLTLMSGRAEGWRSARDRLATIMVYSAFGIAMVPLVSLVWEVVSKGLPVLDLQFLTFSMRGVIGEGGGVYHALAGTLLVTGLAALISVPVGLFTAIYLVEYGRGALARTITFLVDVMTGIPSIVAGLFAYALFVLAYGPGVRMGAAGAVALSVLMIPVVVRSSEEMLKLVPNELREASYALGVPRWRTIVKVVLPTALAGIVTGVMLAVARVIGETAPLLVVAGFTTSTNFNLFSDRMMTLPVFTYYSYTQPGVPPGPGIARAWGAALLLIIIVMGLNLIARLVSRYFAPKTGR